MRTRLLAAVAVIVLAGIAIVAVRVMHRAPESPSETPAAAVTAPASSAPLAEASASPEAPPSAPGTEATSAATMAATASPGGTQTTPATVAPATAPAVGLVTTPPSVAPTVAATDDPNLLALSNGTFVRRWSIGVSGSGGNALPAGGGYIVEPAFRSSIVLDFELPSVARVARFGAAVRGANVVHLRFAIATVRGAFTDAGTLEIAANGGDEKPLAVDKQARYVRVTIQRAPNTKTIVARIPA